MLATALIKDISYEQPLIFFSADHLIGKEKIFFKEIKKHQNYLTDKNIFIFGIKPTIASSEYGYFITKKNKNINRVTKFIEKPNELKAKKIIKQKGYWNSGMFFLTKESLINNFKKYQVKLYKSCLSLLITQYLKKQMKLML